MYPWNAYQSHNNEHIHHPLSFLLVLCDSSHLPPPVHLFLYPSNHWFAFCYLYINLLFLGYYINGINSMYSFGLAFSHSMIILRFIHVSSCICSSFLLINNIPMCGYTAIYLSILGCFQFWMIVNKAAINIHTYIYLCMGIHFYFFWINTYGVQYIGHMVDIRLIL